LYLADDGPDGALLLNIEIIKGSDVAGRHNHQVEVGDGLGVRDR
jgi:hypothetical protein